MAIICPIWYVLSNWYRDDCSSLPHTVFQYLKCFYQAIAAIGLSLWSHWPGNLAKLSLAAGHMGLPAGYVVTFCRELRTLGLHHMSVMSLSCMVSSWVDNIFHSGKRARSARNTSAILYLCCGHGTMSWGISGDLQSFSVNTLLNTVKNKEWWLEKSYYIGHWKCRGSIVFEYESSTGILTEWATLTGFKYTEISQNVASVSEAEIWKILWNGKVRVHYESSFCVYFNHEGLISIQVTPHERGWYKNQRFYWYNNLLLSNSTQDMWFAKNNEVISRDSYPFA